MFTPLYYMCLAFGLLFIQKSKEQGMLVIAFFVLLLCSPVIRNYLQIPYSYYYSVLSIMWVGVVLFFETNRVRQCIFVGSSLLSFLPYQDLWFKIVVVEISVIAFFWATKLDDLLRYISGVLESKFKRKINEYPIRSVQKLEVGDRGWVNSFALIPKSPDRCSGERCNREDNIYRKSTISK